MVWHRGYVDVTGGGAGNIDMAVVERVCVWGGGEGMSNMT